MSTVMRVVEAQARTYSRTWRGSVFTSFLNPLLLLLAMGIGLGSLVDANSATPSSGSYLAFLAPGLLAATAMQTAAGESSYPVMAGMKWVKTYQAALATPVSVADLTQGQLIWTTIRVFQVTAIFGVVAVALGAMPITGGLLAILPATITGAAFAGPITWYTANLEQETGLSSLFRFVIVPLFLFSGTFFPISQLPAWLEPVAYLVPLWHGVELTRAVALDVSPAWPWAAHLMVLMVVASFGAWGAQRKMHRRLRV